LTLNNDILSEHAETVNAINEAVEPIVPPDKTVALLMIAERLERLGEMLEDRLLKIESRL
jgi:hypothetical protein